MLVQVMGNIGLLMSGASVGRHARPLHAMMIQLRLVLIIFTLVLKPYYPQMDQMSAGTVSPSAA